MFERTFKEFGLPHAIRTDNGVPVASGHALYGLSKLAVWWLGFGIDIERTTPGHPDLFHGTEGESQPLRNRPTVNGVPNGTCRNVLRRPACR